MIVQKKNSLQAKIKHLALQSASAYAKRDYKSMEKYCLKILKISPKDYDIMLNLGVAYVMQNDTEAAKTYFIKAMAVDPAKSTAYINLATLYAKTTDPQKAVEIYQRALNIHRCRDITLYNNLGTLLQEIERYEEAEPVFLDLVDLFPNSFMGYVNLGNNYFYRKQYLQATTSFQQALRLHPTCAEAYNGIAMVYQENGDFQNALKNYKIALECNPNLIQTQINVVQMEVSLSPENAENLYLDFLLKYPENPKICNSLAYVYLKKGNLLEGFRYYEYRSDPAIKNSSTKIPPYPFPKWSMQPLANKSIIVVQEQGFGDQLQFIRYITLLKEGGASKIYVVCELGLKNLFRAIPGVDAVATAHEPIPVADYWTFIMSLPHQFKTTLQTIPAKIPYLFPDQEKVEKFKNLLPQGKKKIGIVWRGNKKHYNDTNRSLTLKEFEPLWKLKDEIVFISVQKGDGEDEAINYPPYRPIINLCEHINDFSDTAALMANLDMLISVDTAVVHLAGALGLKCYVMLPSQNSDWRWLEERNDSPWYPSITLFRQQTGEEWKSVIDRISTALSIL